MTDQRDRTINVGFVVVGPFQEGRPPRQWIAYCTTPDCKVGIRCNDEGEAHDFMWANCSHYRRGIG